MKIENLVHEGMNALSTIRKKSSHQAVARQSSSSCQAVIRQLSGSQLIKRQPTDQSKDNRFIHSNNWILYISIRSNFHHQILKL